jgi:hypothetical protein
VVSVQHVFHHVVIKIRQLFLQPAACLTSTLLETGVTANAAGTNSLTCLPKHGRDRDDKLLVTHPMAVYLRSLSTKQKGNHGIQY